MKARETLVPQHAGVLEDTLIELMLEAAIEEDGLLVLNMPSDSEAYCIVPNDLTKQNVNLINACFARKTHKNIQKQATSVLKHIFLGTVICLTLLSAAFKYVPEVRRIVYEGIVDSLEGETKRKVGELLGFNISIPPEVAVHWLPEGYTLAYSTPGMSSTVTWSSYKNPDNKEITIDVYDVSSGVVSLDTEDAEIKNIEVNGFPTMVILKETHNQIAITNNTALELCVIYSDYAPVEDLLKVAEGIEFK